MKQARGKIGGYMSAALKAEREASIVWNRGDERKARELDALADRLRFEAARWKAKLKEFPKKKRRRHGLAHG